MFLPPSTSARMGYAPQNSQPWMRVFFECSYLPAPGPMPGPMHEEQHASGGERGRGAPAQHFQTQATGQLMPPGLSWCC